MTDRVVVHIRRLSEVELVSTEVRDAHAVWCELLCDVRRAARDMFMLGHVNWARFLAHTADQLDRKARLHLNRITKDAKELQEERAA